MNSQKINWEDFFQAINHPVLILDSKYRVLAVNTATEKLIGLPKSEMEGMCCFQIIHSPDSKEPHSNCPIEKLLKKGKTEATEIEILNGIALVSCTPLMDYNGNFNKINHIVVEIIPLAKFEDALTKSEEKYHSLLTAASDAILLSDLDGNLLESNTKAQKLLGYNPEEILQLHIKDIHPADELIRVKRAFKDVMVGDIQITDSKILNKEQKEISVDITGSLITFGDKQVIQGIFRDITELKKIHNQLKDSEEKYRLVLETAGEAILLLDRNGNVVEANQKALELTGFGKEELVGENLTTIVPKVKVNLKEVSSAFKDILSGKPISKTEWNIINKNGDSKILILHYTLIKKDGEVWGVTLVLEDVTELKMTTKILEKNEVQMYGLISNLPGMVYRCRNDENWTMQYLSEQCQTLTGYKPSELINSRKIAYGDLIHPEDQEKVWADIQKSLSKSESFQVNYRIITREGKVKWIWERGFGIMDDEGELELEGFIEDISELKKATLAIEESEKLYKSIFENTGAGTFIMDDKGTITMANSEMEVISGYSREEVENKLNWMDFIPSEELTMMIGYQKQRKKDPTSIPSRYESRLINRMGDIRNMMVTVDLIPNSDNCVVSIVDITDLRVAENNLKKSLEEKEVLIREVHHRVKNNMQIISSLLNLQSQFVDEPFTQNILKESQGRVKAMAMIHEKLYQSHDLSRIQFRNYLEKLVSDIMYSYRTDKDLIGLFIQVEDREIGMETAIPLGLIINELVTNSIKYAFPHGEKGNITVKLKTEGDKNILILADDGVGLPEHIKPDNTNTLGLQMVDSLVKQLDGEIDLDCNHGTKYTITFRELNYPQRI